MTFVKVPASSLRFRVPGIGQYMLGPTRVLNVGAESNLHQRSPALQCLSLQGVLAFP